MRYCAKGNALNGNGNTETCNCNELSSDGTISRTCKRCYVRKAAPAVSSTSSSNVAAQPRWYTNPQGLVAECTSCKAPRFMLNGECVTQAACPSDMTQYRIGTAMGWRCEAPFTCTARHRADGAPCKCPKPRLCKSCVWNAHGKNSSTMPDASCTHCTKGWYLHDGVCVQPAECIQHGRLPVRRNSGDGGGGACLMVGEIGT